MIRRAGILLVVLILVVAAAPVLSRAEVADTTLTFRGLVMLEWGDSGLRAVFLSPADNPHPSTLTLDASALSGNTDLPPNMVLPSGDGHGLAVWRFQEVVLDATNVAETTIEAEEGAVRGEAARGDRRLSWIPRMQDIYGAPQQLDESKVGLASAKGQFAVGRIEPVFDLPQSRSQLFTIGQRQCTALADAVRLRVSIKDASKPLLRIVRDGVAGGIVVTPGANIELAALPLNKSVTNLEHFHHFFDLLQGSKRQESISECQAGRRASGVYPIKCTPSMNP
jgi:hypothetical protein